MLFSFSATGKITIKELKILYSFVGRSNTVESLGYNLDIIIVLNSRIVGDKDHEYLFIMSRRNVMCLGIDDNASLFTNVVISRQISWNLYNIIHNLHPISKKHVLKIKQGILIFINGI